jgi:hypothetical protein
MIERRKSFFGVLPCALFATAIYLCLLAPVSAVLLEVTEKGYITGLNLENNTMTLAPGETAFFNGRNDNSSISVAYLDGQASAYGCSDT